MRTARLGVLPLLLTALLIPLAGCGDEPSHGMARDGFQNKPTGDEIQPGFAVTDGEMYTATVEFAWDLHHVAGGKTTDQSGRRVIDITWTMKDPVQDAPPSSTVRLRYTEAEGLQAEAFLAQEPIIGILEHADSGRVRPRTLKLQGGTADQQHQVQDTLVSLLLAGFGGSYPWMPDRPVRVGETWALEAFTKPRTLDNLRRYARETGLSTPEPTYAGTGVLRGIVEEDGERWFDVEIEALVEQTGVANKGTERGRIALGDKVTGRALISVERGVPKHFEVSQHQTTKGSDGASQGVLDVRGTFRGTVVHTRPAK